MAPRNCRSQGRSRRQECLRYYHLFFQNSAGAFIIGAESLHVRTRLLTRF